MSATLRVSDIATTEGVVMHTAVRKPLMAGVVLAGASVIAVSPVAPPLPDIHVPAVYSSSVHLTTSYQELIANTLDNAGALLDTFLSAPAPILTQILANQIASVQGIVAGVGGTVSDTLTALTVTVPTLLQEALAALAVGDLVTVTENLLAIPVELLVFPTTDNLIQPLADAFVNPLRN